MSVGVRAIAEVERGTWEALTTTLKSSSSCVSNASACLPSSSFSGATAAKILAASLVTILDDAFTEDSTPVNRTPGTRRSSLIDSIRLCTSRICLLSMGSAFRSNARAFCTGFAARDARSLITSVGIAFAPGTNTIVAAIKPTPRFFAALVNAETGPSRSVVSFANARRGSGPRRTALRRATREPGAPKAAPAKTVFAMAAIVSSVSGRMVRAKHVSKDLMESHSLFCELDKSKHRTRDAPHANTAPYRFRSHMTKTALCVFDTKRGRGRCPVMSRWDAAAPTPPPVDPIQRNVVEKLAEYRARNGEGFVDVVRSKQAGNSLYDFLHRGPEDAIFTYYRQCVELHTAVAPQHETPTRTVPPPPPLRVLLPTAVPTEAARDQTGKAHASDFPHDSGFDFPPGLIPALARAANGSTGRNYVPVHKTDIACARALAEAAFDALAHGVSDELIDLESTREYLSQRVKRW